MSKRVLVPLYRLEVEYQIKHGRRWSALEHLVLWGCETPASVQELARRSGMRVRLVSESLVNLLRGGWIELRAAQAGNTFAATGAGREAAAKPLPDQFMETQGRSALVYMDRLSGEIFSSKELDVIRRDASDFRFDEALEPNLYKPVFHGPELLDRLPLGDDDTFDRLRGTRQVPSELFAIIGVEAERITGLPSRTPASTGLAIRASLEDALTKGRLSAVSLPSPEAALGSALKDRRLSVPLRFGPDTLVVGGPEHLAAANSIIRQARRIVVIHSTFVGRNIKHLFPALCDAAASGAQIYIHWGKEDDPEGLAQNPSAMAARLAQSEIPTQHRNKIHLGARSTGSHAKIVLADTGNDEEYCVLVGSCNWLDSPFKSVEASVRLAEPAAVGQIAGRLAAILVPIIGQDLIVDRLVAIQAECAHQPASSALHSVMLVVDDDHYTAVRDAMREVGRDGTIVLGSHKFGHAGETTVLDPMLAAAHHGARVRLFFTKVLPNFGDEAAATKVNQMAAGGVELRQAAEEMHAKFIGWNSKLLVTSFNFLSASLNGRHRSGSEFGALLQGPGIVEDFESKLRAHGVYSESRGAKRKRQRRRKSVRRSPNSPPAP